MINNAAVVMPAGRHAVVLFHGLSSTPVELRYIAKGLHQKGYSVHMPVIEGYTQSVAHSEHKEMTPHTSWIKEALKQFDEICEKYDSVSVGGLCIGAILALHIAARRPNHVASVLSLSTTLHYDGWAVPWRQRLLPIARALPTFGRIPIHEMHPYGVKDERLRTWIKRQMEKVGGSVAGSSILRVKDLVQAKELIRTTRQRFRDVTAPLLLVHSREDEAASPRSAYEVAENVGSKNIRCIILTDSYHMISIDQEKERTLGEICDFLQTVKPMPIEENIKLHLAQAS